MAPAVFQPYSRPSTGPNRGSYAMSVRVSSGSVTPMAVDGISRTRKATASRSALSSQGSSNSGCTHGARAAPRPGSRYTMPTPVTAIATSAAAYARNGFLSRSP